MIRIHNHGYVAYVEHMGSDESVIRAARMSTGKGFQGWDKDLRLLQYLWKKGHVSPFEFCNLVVEVQCPVFVARQILRHWSLSVNEHSARYSELAAAYYVPEVVKSQGTINKQGSAAPVDGETQRWFQDSLMRAQAFTQDLYEEAVARGVSREQARIVLTFGINTRLRLNGNLRDWLFFLQKRLAADTQEETRDYAEAVAAIVETKFPKTFALFQEGLSR